MSISITIRNAAILFVAAMLALAGVAEAESAHVSSPVVVHMGDCC